MPGLSGAAVRLEVTSFDFWYRHSIRLIIKDAVSIPVVMTP